MIEILTLVLLFVFYAAYFLKLLAQRRQGIRTNVMVRGQKSAFAQRLGLALMIVTYLTVAIQVLSCLQRAWLIPIALPDWLRWLGVGLTGGGTALFIIAFMTLRDSWRAGIDESQKTDLITGGVYAISRNPAFAGFDLTYLGCALSVCNAAMLVAAVVAMTVLHLQILEEEKHLRRTFGKAYEDYARRVRRYL